VRDPLRVSKDRAARASLGRAGEERAEAYLTGLGFRILARQHRCRRGEVDLVAEEGDCLCFVEVRARSPGPVGPLESVTVPKQRRVILAALDYLVRHGIPVTGARAMRFDVVEIHRTPEGELRPELCRNAFEGSE
jgi:putative endonuclease